jgi:hypothetical protein
MVAPGTARGTVAFFSGSTALGSGELRDGKAIKTVTFYGSGDQTLTAAYSGNATYATSVSNDMTITVGSPGSAPTTASLSLDSSSIPIGSTALITATISPSDATGQIAFYDGSMLLGTRVISSGSATLTQPFSTSGTHLISAVYSGDPAYESSVSANQPLAVN